MPSKENVFVIGAGASKEANLPTGDILKIKIAELLDIRGNPNRDLTGDPVIIDALKDFSMSGKTSDFDKGYKTGVPEIAPYIEAAKEICDGLPYSISIDDLLYKHGNNEKLLLCGKLAIARAILQAESSSLLYPFKNQLKTDNLNDAWYLTFFRQLTEKCEISDLPERLGSLVLIIFNYDRCIEHFLFHALKTVYPLSDNDAADLINSMVIYHPYGRVGSLPWMGEDDAIDFGSEPDKYELLTLTNKIKTFSEKNHSDSENLSAMKSDMKNANKVVYLGYHFHPINMQLISPPRSELGSEPFPQMFATVKGMSENNQKVVKGVIRRGYYHQTNVILSNTGCKDFFTENEKMLSFV